MQLAFCSLQQLFSPSPPPPPPSLPPTPIQEELHVATGEMLVWLMVEPRALERRIEAETGRKKEAG